MENIKLEFENLSYQDFWEDKILLIEYNLTPINTFIKISELRKIFYFKTMIINQHKYHFRFTSQDIMNRHLYNLVIYVSIPPRSTTSLREHLKHDYPDWALKSVYFNGNFINCVVYSHKIPLSWEEINDRWYLNFIIQSVSESLKENIKNHYKDIINAPQMIKYLKESNIIEIQINQ